MKGSRRPQRGVALLLILFLLFGIGTTLFLLVWNANATRLSLEAKTTDALAQAKEALIGRAVSDDNRPGSLPCPDTNGDGTAESLVGSSCPSYIGRLPYKTLKIADLRDSEGELLWYALSSTLRDHTTASPINPNTPATLTLDGNTNIAAILFAPGPALAGQGGRPSNLVGDYLDAGNADGDANYISVPFSSTFNDRVMALTQAELFAAVSRRVLGAIRGVDDLAPSFPNTGLRSYHQFNGQFPWADSDGDGLANLNILTGKLPYKDLVLDAWISNNNWPSLIVYTRISANSAQISIGTSTLKVVPCTTLPCP